METSSPRILVAEDNAACAGVLEFTLGRAGFDVVLIANGREAMSAVEAEPFDAIITDYQMPGACGKDVIHAARNGAVNAETPIVLCSAKGLELDTVQLQTQYRLAKILYKPFSPRDVVDMVRSLPKSPSASCAAGAD